MARDGDIDLLEADAEGWRDGRGEERIEGLETGVDDASQELGEEQGQPTTVGGQLVAELAAEASEEAFSAWACSSAS